MSNTKPVSLSYSDFIKKLQRTCDENQQPSSLVFIEINNAVQVARLLQGFWAEKQLIKRLEQVIVEHVTGLNCLTISKINHQLFALIFDLAIQETTEIVESLAEILHHKDIEIIDLENQTDAKVYFPKLNIGVTPLTPIYHQAELAITAAEEALYQTRRVGSSIVKVVQPDNHRLHQYFDCLQTLPILRAGLVENAFILYAQPIVPINHQQETQKAEILLRYKDQNGRVFSPKKFLRTANLFNASREVDLYIIKHFCRFLQSHPTDVVYSFNISGSTVRYPLFFDYVKQMFTQYAITPEQVCFEITETVADKDYEQTSELMFKLKHELGCQLALDDIGIGSSNLSNLPKFHVDYLKIDGYFIQHLLSEPYSEQVIRFIVSSARLLNKKTIAEFVENAEQRKKLQELGVDYIQGYLTGHPTLLFDPQA